MVFLILCSSLIENLDQSGEEGFISGIECSAFPFSRCNSTYSLGNAWRSGRVVEQIAHRSTVKPGSHSTPSCAGNVSTYKRL
jgi:hypothetical protein